MKYLKLFTSHSDYNTAKSSLDKPNVSHCITENEVHYNPWTYADTYLTFVAKEDGTFQLSRNAVSYSLDNGETWTELAAATASPTVTAGNKIMWKGELTPTSSGVGTFSATGNFDVQGNVMSLLFGDNFNGKTDLTGKNFVFFRLFYQNTKVVSAENLSLPATTLTSNCYGGMFNGCTGLVSVPELPATTLAQGCYQSMFQGCTSLTTVPELPATTMAATCYYNMFYSCTSLTTVPDELPATILASNCYNGMFYYCTSITTAPELPATTLEQGCYQDMFRHCTNLVTAPQLPATTLAQSCYNSMFYDCTSLVNVPDELPATTLAQGCYQSMFQGCTSLEKAPAILSTGYARWAFSNMYSGCENLNYIKTMITTIVANSQYTPKGWANGVSSSGTFVMNSAAEWNPEDYRGETKIVPNNWTVQTVSA